MWTCQFHHLVVVIVHAQVLKVFSQKIVVVAIQHVELFKVVSQHLNTRFVCAVCRCGHEFYEVPRVLETRHLCMA